MKMRWVRSRNISRQERKSIPSGLRHALGVEILLESGECSADFFGLPEICHGVLNRAILEAEQRNELLLVELLHAHRDVVGENKAQEDLLFTAEAHADLHLCLYSVLLTGDRGHGVGQHAEEITVLGVVDLLYLCHLLIVESCLC